MSASISHVPLLYCYQWFLFIPVTNRLHRQRLRRERVQATLPETQPRIGVNLVVSVSISLSRLYSRFGSLCMIVHHASSRFVSFNCSMCWSCFQVMCFMFHGFSTLFYHIFLLFMVYHDWDCLLVFCLDVFIRDHVFKCVQNDYVVVMFFQQPMDCFCMFCGYVVFTMCFKNVLSYSLSWLYHVL